MENFDVFVLHYDPGDTLRHISPASQSTSNDKTETKNKCFSESVVVCAMALKSISLGIGNIVILNIFPSVSSKP